jgi:hypothetical protein
MKRFVSLLGLLALVLSLTIGVTGGGRVYAQDATPSAGACANNPDESEQVVRGASVASDDSVAGVLVVVREVKASSINVYARCLGSDETIKAHQGFDIWSGYPSLEYANHDACMQAVADANTAATDGSWASGKTVTYDGQPVPASCGSTSDPIFSTQDKEVVSEGTVVLQVAVDMINQREDVRALILEKDTKTVFNEDYRLMQFVGYESLEAAQNDVCAQAQRDASTAALDNGWNEGFTITINDGQPLSGCPAS